MKRAILITALSILSLTAAAFDPYPLKGDRIGILRTVVPVDEEGRPIDNLREGSAVEKMLPRYLEKELRRAGFKPYRVEKTIEDLDLTPVAERKEADGFLIEVVFADAAAEPVVGVGTGGTIGTVGVGGEISMVVAQAHAEVRLYDAETLDMIARYEVDSEAVQPALTAIGLGGRSGFIGVGLPFFSQPPYRRASYLLAREAVKKIQPGTRSEEE